jgi:hypothetical protein
VLLLAGCGDLSLVDALQGDSPGELRFSPVAALVPEQTAFAFTILGGFLPYDIALNATLTPKDDRTWIFEGGEVTDPDITANYTIEVTDLLGKTATAVVTVYKLSPLTLNVQEVTLVQGDSWTFTVTGGLSPYTWELEDEPQAPVPDTDNAFTYEAGAEGTYTLSVTDSIEVSRIATVLVVPVPPALQITPTSASVLTGGQLAFTALGGTSTYSFSATGGSITNTNPATYTAPGTAGTRTISVTDGVDTVLATVSVIEAPPLVLSPESPTVSAVGDTVQFTASGGTPPYSFSSKKPWWGSMDAETGLYTQLRKYRKVGVAVRDAAGTLVTTVVKWRR